MCWTLESTQSTGVAPSEENDQEIRELAATFYSDIPPDEFVIDWATKLGASACTKFATSRISRRLPNWGPFVQRASCLQPKNVGLLTSSCLGTAVVAVVALRRR